MVERSNSLFFYSGEEEVRGSINKGHKMRPLTYKKKKKKNNKATKACKRRATVESALTINM